MRFRAAFQQFTTLAAWLPALLLIACNSAPPSTAPSIPSAAAPGASGQAMRYADVPLPPATFTDPGRRAKLEAAFPEIERYLAAEAKKMNLPGLAAGIVIDGELVYSKGFGVRDLESNAPVDADSVFRIASMTKSFTAVAILKLRDEGQLSLEDPAAKYVPELASLPYPTRDSAPITIRRLLSHSEGFPEDNPWGDRQLAMSEEDFTRLLKQGLPFSNAPGVQFEYSNFGFAILGRIVSRVSGIPYRDYVTTNVLRPLGMSATVLDERQAPPDRLARGYRREDNAFVVEANLPDGAFGAMGGMYSSVRDMARYAAFHLAAWPPRDDFEAGPLRRSSAREMQQAARATGLVVAQGTENGLKGTFANGYGFGFSAWESCHFDHVVTHGGGLPGYGSHLYMLPQHGVAFITLASLTYARTSRLSHAMARILASTGALQKRVVTPAPALTQAQHAVNRLLAQWDDKEADAAFADSFFLDVPRAKLKADLDTLRAAHGACRPNGAIDAENGLRGTWKLSCEKGSIDLGLTLAPTMPPKIQALTKNGNLPPSPKLSEMAAKLVGLAGHWDDAFGETLFDPDKLDAEHMKKLFADTQAARGACKMDKPVGGNGKTQARLSLSCDRYPVVLDFTLGEQSGKVESVRFESVDFRAGKCLQ